MTSTTRAVQVPTQLGMLAYAGNDVVNGDIYWTTAGQQITAALNQNLQASITGQLYYIVHRTYENATSGQWWYGSVAAVTAPGGPMADYIASRDDERSVWFTDFVQESNYVTATELWLQSAAQSVVPQYPPTALCYALFSGDGFGDTASWGYTGAFSKNAVYNGWLMTTDELYNNGAAIQEWTYGTGGNLVTATVSGDMGLGPFTVPCAWTDAYGKAALNTDDPEVQQINAQYGFQQQVIVNYLGPIN
jgi:hypothetical protein